MPEKRVALMVSEGLKDWVMEEIQRLTDAYERNEYKHAAYNPDTRNPNAPRISVESFLMSLLEARQRHRERRRKAKLSRRAKRRAVPTRLAILPDGNTKDRSGLEGGAG